jgi:ABC-2 type transport system ATP-binding protein
MDAAIETDGLSGGYGRVAALSDFTLTVQTGSIFALLGPNGAGKTTAIRLLMNLIRPKSGRAHVLGTEVTRLGPETLAQVGYVSEGQALPDWMTVDEVAAFCRPFYPTWDASLYEKLRAQFDLPPDARLRRLSRGMRIKAALLVSLAYRPRLLVLDEPFSGLDPVVRDDLIRGVLLLAEQEQWSVFMSSHEMEDVERLADSIGFIDDGRLALVEPATQLLGRFRQIDVATPEPVVLPAEPPPGWLHLEGTGRVVRFVDTSSDREATDARVRALFPGADVQVRPMSLREIFIAIAKGRQATAATQELGL